MHLRVQTATDCGDSIRLSLTNAAATLLTGIVSASAAKDRAEGASRDASCDRSAYRVDAACWDPA